MSCAPRVISVIDEAALAHWHKVDERPSQPTDGRSCGVAVVGAGCLTGGIMASVFSRPLDTASGRCEW